MADSPALFLLQGLQNRDPRLYAYLIQLDLKIIELEKRIKELENP